MPHSNLRVPVVLAALVTSIGLGLSGCGKKSASGKTKPTMFRLPWLDPAGNTYELRDVEIKTLTDPRKLKGEAAQIFVAPEYDDSRGFFNKEPNFRFIKSGKVLIPADTLTLQAATVYAHLERLQEIDAQLSLKEVKKHRKVGIEAKWRIGKDNAVLTNNALYDGRTDAMVIVPYDSDDLPIALNAGVVAHEYSHAIFFALVRNPIISKLNLSSAEMAGGHFADDEKQNEAETKAQREITSKTFNLEFALRAADEGLADYWAWLYTTDDTFMGRSLKSEESKRRLDVAPKKFLTLNTWIKNGNKAVAQKKSLTSFAYRQGTDYARFFRELTVRLGMADGKEKRIAMAKRLIPALRLFSDKFSSQFDQFTSPDLLLASYLEANSDLIEAQCGFFQEMASAKDSLQVKGCD